MASGRRRKGIDLHLDEQQHKVKSAFSTSSIHRIFSSFSGEKLAILESVGLLGLTKIKRITKLNRSLAIWLLQNMDCKTGSVLFGDGSSKEIKDVDVQLILGINVGMEEISLPATSNQTMEKVTELLFLPPGSAISLDHLESLLCNNYGPHMSQTEKDAFLVAAVIFADAHFLAPKGDRPTINKRLLQHLANTVLTNKWNWCGYVLDALKSASIRVQDCLQRSIKSVTIDGCLLLLEIFYLDNLDFGSMMLPYVSIPRMVDFSNDRIKAYIGADSNGELKCSFGRTKTKKPTDVLYSWSQNVCIELPCKYPNDHKFFRGTTVQYITTLLEDNKGSSGDSIHALSEYIAIRNRLMGGAESGGTSNAASTGDFFATEEPDLHGPNLILNYDLEIIAKEVFSFSNFCASPSQLGSEAPKLVGEVSNEAVRAMTNRVARMDEEEMGKVWFLHDVPSVLLIKGKTLNNQVVFGADLEWNFIDAALRMFSLLDGSMCREGSNQRWRHYLPSFWAIDVLRGGDLNQSEEIRDMFIGEHISYNVEDCRMIIAPVLVGSDWHCYAWDFQGKCISVLDPTRMDCCDVEIEHVHRRIVERLHDALFDCKNTFFRGWNVTRKGWSSRFPTFPNAGGPRELSGVYGLQFARDFNGQHLEKIMSTDEAVFFREELRYQLLKMPGNLATISCANKE